MCSTKFVWFHFLLTLRSTLPVNFSLLYTVAVFLGRLLFSVYYFSILSCPIISQGFCITYKQSGSFPWSLVRRRKHDSFLFCAFSIAPRSRELIQIKGVPWKALSLLLHALHNPFEGSLWSILGKRESRSLSRRTRTQLLSPFFTLEAYFRFKIIYFRQQQRFYNIIFAIVDKNSCITHE